MVTVHFDDPAEQYNKWSAYSYKITTLLNQKKYTEARPYAQEAYEFAEKARNAQWAANALSNLGHLEHMVGNLSKADSYYRKALEIIISCAGREDLEAGMVAANFATLLYDKGEYQLAEAGYLEAIKIKKLHLPPDHHSLEKTVLNLAQMYKNLGYAEKAERLIRDELPSSKHQSWKP